jgi:hypothetical protein
MLMANQEFVPLLVLLIEEQINSNPLAEKSAIIACVIASTSESFSSIDRSRKAVGFVIKNFNVRESNSGCTKSNE